MASASMKLTNSQPSMIAFESLISRAQDSSCQAICARIRSQPLGITNSARKGWGKAGQLIFPASNVRPSPICKKHNLQKTYQAGLTFSRRRPGCQKSATLSTTCANSCFPEGGSQIAGAACRNASKSFVHFEKRREEKHLGRRKHAPCCSENHENLGKKDESRLSLAERFVRLFPRDKRPAGSSTEHGKQKEEESRLSEPDGPFEIQLQDVSRVYGKRTVVDGVNLGVQQGEVVGLLGPNGAGKSTTFNITVGRERPSHGSVRLNGHDITALPLDARARLGVGYLTQEPSVFRGLSVHDNLLLVLQETGVPRSAHSGRIAELLAEFRLTHVRNTMGGALSGGERRRTELARALASNCSGGPPKLLLVDEPFAGVDPIGVAEIQGLLRRLCDELHMGILITDHNLTETLKICDRAYMVFEGRVMAHGSPQELVQNPFVRQYYLGEGYRHPDLQAVGGAVHGDVTSL